MKSWTRTLNIDDAHTLLGLARPGVGLDAWTNACHAAQPELSVARRRELIRLLRDGFIEWTPDEKVGRGLFLDFYQRAPAMAQLDLVDLQWALSHPITILAIDGIVAPHLRKAQLDVPFDEVEAFVAKHLNTESAESTRKTRTVLLGALEGIGTLVTRGTGQHRSLRAARAEPHPLAFGYLVHRELRERGADAMMRPEVIETSLAARATQCGEAYAEECLTWCLSNGVLREDGDEVLAEPAFRA